LQIADFRFPLEIGWHGLDQNGFGLQYEIFNLKSAIENFCLDQAPHLATPAVLL